MDGWMGRLLTIGKGATLKGNGIRCECIGREGRSADCNDSLSLFLSMTMMNQIPSLFQVWMLIWRCSLETTLIVNYKNIHKNHPIQDPTAFIPSRPHKGRVTAFTISEAVGQTRTLYTQSKASQRLELADGDYSSFDRRHIISRYNNPERKMKPAYYDRQRCFIKDAKQRPEIPAL